MAESIIKISDQAEVSVDASCERLRQLSVSFERFIVQMNEVAGRATITLQAHQAEALPQHPRVE